MSRFTEPERVEQRIEALRLWMAGATYRTIAKKLKVNHQTAYKRVQDAIDEMRPHADFDQYRATQLAELSIARRPLRTIIATWKPGDDYRPIVAALDALLKLQDRESKLVGIDRVDTPFDELSQMSDDELSALVEEWQSELA